MFFVHRFTWRFDLKIQREKKWTNEFQLVTGCLNSQRVGTEDLGIPLIYIYHEKYPLFPKHEFSKLWGMFAARNSFRNSGSSGVLDLPKHTQNTTLFSSNAPHLPHRTQSAHARCPACTWPKGSSWHNSDMNWIHSLSLNRFIFRYGHMHACICMVYTNAHDIHHQII